MPSPHKTPEQEEAEEELLTRLVALNQERTAEERRGTVRWLRPDYQKPKLGHKVRKPEDVEQVEAQLIVPAPADGKPTWPKDEMDRISIVRDMLSRAPGPVAPETLGVAFDGKNSARRTEGVEKALQTLVAAGVAQQGIDGQDGSSRFGGVHSPLGLAPKSAHNHARRHARGNAAFFRQSSRRRRHLDAEIALLSEEGKPMHAQHIDFLDLLDGQVQQVLPR